MVDKLLMQTKDLSQEKIQRIGEIFPNCVTETKNGDEIVLSVDFDALRQELSDHVVEGQQERYQFTWPDKSKSKRLANTPTTMTLRPCREDSVDFDNTKNLYIEGDNLEVLKILRETYLGKVKMIYIDPPYNTGNDFVYNDDFSTSANEYLETSGDVDDSGNRLFLNTSTNGRFHTDWLNMIYPRLALARSFLTEDGAIFISIDDNEQSNLKHVCDEIFGEQNFVTTFTWAAGRKNDSKLVSVSHEYILCYVRSMDYLRDHSVKWRERKQGLDEIYAEYELLKKQYGTDYVSMSKELKKWYKSLESTNPSKNHKHYCNVDSRGIFFADNISWPGGGGPKYEVLHPETKKPVKVPSRGWLYSEKRLQELIDDDRVVFGDDENSVPCVKSYLREHETSAPYSVFYKDGRASTKRLRELMEGDVFQNPKDEEIIQSLIQFCTDKKSIVMDFFSGSASAAHATFLQNMVDGGDRSFILVQIPESLENIKGTSEASKGIFNNAIGMLGDKPHNICEIGKERIRRAGKKLKAQSTLDSRHLDVGFRVLKLDSSNMRDVYYSPDQTSRSSLDDYTSIIKSDRTSEDLLIQVMLELGIELSVTISNKEIDGHTVFDIDNGYLIACFEDNLDDRAVTAISKIMPDSAYAVFRSGQSMTDDTLSNIEQIFKTYSPQTKIRIL